MRRHELLTARFRPDSVVIRSDSLRGSPMRMDTVLVAVTRTVSMSRSDSATRANAPRTPVRPDTIGVCTGGAGRGRGGRGAGGGGGAGRGAAPAGTRQVEELTGESHGVLMSVHDRFGAARKEAIPVAYLFGAEFSKVVEMMRRQGIEVRRTTAAWTGNVGHFAVDSVSRPGYFEGHCMTRVEGNWSAPTSESIPAGTYVVPTAQRLGMLAAFLLEPASEDGYATWNFFDASLALSMASRR